MIQNQTTFATRHDLESYQLSRLNGLIQKLISGNQFYGPRLEAAGLKGNLTDLAQFEALPLTTKQDLVADHLANPPYGSNLSEPLTHYVRYHQTSGSTGKPLRWLDTQESWQALLDCWQCVYQAAGANPEKDRVYFAFSFGPFLGFWTAFEAASQMGMMCLPGGGLSSQARLSQILDNEATILCCTPTYALRLIDVAKELGHDLNKSSIHTVIVAGEPGGAIPGIREAISKGWGGARVFDHHGMTEVGPVTYETKWTFADTSGEPVVSLAVMEHSFLVEVIDPETGEALKPASAGDSVKGELVLTTLARIASPLLRYRTGDMVEVIWPDKPNPDDLILAPYAILKGGILGRSDDMILVRGVNIYPTAIDTILRKFPEMTEYRVTVYENRGMQELSVEIELNTSEDDKGTIGRIAESLKDHLALRVPVKQVPLQSLPRFEMKARRFVKATDSKDS